MRCKKHLTDLTSSIGVCATCLTERLSALIEAQALAEGAQLARSLKPDHQLDRHRKSDYARPNQHHQHTLSDQLFFYTPQVGPTVVPEEPKSGNFCLLSRLFFRSRPASASSSSSTRPSWFSNMLYPPSRRQKREPNRSSVDGDRRPQRRWRSDRGMSPARVSDCRGDDEGCGEYSSEEWKQTPQRPTATPLRRGGHSRNVSGLKFCLSPLVRASPSRQWNQKGIMQPEVSIHGEVRVPAVGPRLSTGAANRSRKIADFGRCNHGHR